MPYRDGLVTLRKDVLSIEAFTECLHEPEISGNIHPHDKLNLIAHGCQGSNISGDVVA